MIVIENASYRLPGARILNDISVRIERGKVTALIGPNGAGKSTLLSLIARLEPLQTGRIFVDDLEVGRCADRTLAQHLSILPQTSEQPPRLTVRELVEFGRYPYHQGRPGPRDAEMVVHALEALGLVALADRMLNTLSGGQRQRAQIAMIFAQDTEYVLLDEPLNNLDIAASRALMKTLRDMCDAHGKTILIVVHDINAASRYADYLIALKNGQIAAEGAPFELINDGFVQDVFGTDAKIVESDGEKLVLI